MHNQNAAALHPANFNAAHLHAANLQSTRVHSGMLAIIGRGNSVLAETHLKKLPANTLDAQVAPTMRVYSPKEQVDTTHMQSLGSPADLGGVVLSGEPRIYGQVDFVQGNMTAGIFMATSGKVRITFPFSEHATILEGEVTLTDETGQTRSLKAGDSYFIRQNQVILWDVKGKQVIKSFFNVVEQ